MTAARRPWALAATIAAIAAVIVYVVLIIRQSPGGTIDDPVRVAAVVALLLALAGLAAIGTVSSSSRVRRTSLIVAAVGLIVLGIVALFSIGLLLLFAGLLAAVAAVRERAGGD